MAFDTSKLKQTYIQVTQLPHAKLPTWTQIASWLSVVVAFCGAINNELTPGSELYVDIHQFIPTFHLPARFYACLVLVAACCNSILRLNSRAPKPGEPFQAAVDASGKPVTDTSGAVPVPANESLSDAEHQVEAAIAAAKEQDELQKQSVSALQDKNSLQDKDGLQAPQTAVKASVAQDAIETPAPATVTAQGGTAQVSINAPADVTQQAAAIIAETAKVTAEQSLTDLPDTDEQPDPDTLPGKAIDG